jgi:hypothetical protein
MIIVSDGGVMNVAGKILLLLSLYKSNSLFVFNTVY